MKIVWHRSMGFNIELNKADMSYNGASKINPSPGTQYMEKTIIVDGADCYPWTECFVWWPTKTITGKRLFWTKAYKRRVWIMWGTGFHMEPETQYGTAFDVINDPWEVSGAKARNWGG
jgi:hypothetical protein